MRRVVAIALLAGLGAVFAACGDAPQETVNVGDDPLEWGELYVRSAAVGRNALEDSFVETSNGYARLRLANYGPGRPWSSFAIVDRPVRPVTEDDIGEMDEPWATTRGDFQRLGELTDWSHEGVIAYGKRAFENYPLGEDQTFMHALDSVEDANRFGLWTDGEGRVGGLVRVRLSETSESFAPTCATCHASTMEGELVAGRPNADFDYDGMALHGMSGRATYPPSRWGLGSVDVTPDQVSNPVAMADLRAVRFQRNLHWAGTIENSLPALTVRIETLITTSLGDERPPREVAFAIAYYLWSLGAEGKSGDESLPGARLFSENCAACHGADGSAGPAVEAEVVGTDPLVAESTMRGLANPVYRVPSLWKAGSRGQFLHDGSVDSLETLLSSARRADVPGHSFGMHLSDEKRRELIEFVRTIGASD